MRRWLKPAAIGLACLACCLPFLVPALGITAGTAGAVGAWLAGNEALIVAGAGLAYLAAVTLARRQSADHNERNTGRKEPKP